MTDIEIKERILGDISGIECPQCHHILYVGSVNVDDQTTALFCVNCKLRVKVVLEIVNKGGQ